MGQSRSTRDWLDMYDMMLDRAYEYAKDPVQGALNRGITSQEMEAQKGIAPIPTGTMRVEAYRILRDSWKRVRASLQIFGLELSDDLEIEPVAILQPGSKAFGIWIKKPWVRISRGVEKPLRFDGRDAITAVNFLNLYIQQCETVDPRKRIREALEAQGITKETFHEHVGAAGIRNPWEDDLPVPQKGTPT